MSTTDDPLTELLGVDSSEFLAADWERHPRHIGSATTSFRAALSLDDIAILSAVRPPLKRNWSCCRGTRGPARRDAGRNFAVFTAVAAADQV